MIRRVCICVLARWLACCPADEDAAAAPAADTMTSIEGAITTTFEPEGCKDGQLTKVPL